MNGNKDNLDALRSAVKVNAPLADKLLSRKNPDVLKSLPPQARKRIKVLREIQREHNELEAKFFVERASLEAQYQKLYQELYTKRYDIVNGVEVEQTATETTKTEQEDEPTDEKGVPNFWLTALKNNEILAEEIFERDEEALKFLKDIKWSRIEDLKGYKLEFFFDTNPYFKNNVLTRTIHTIDDDGPCLEKAIGTKIDWHVGNCLTQKILKKKPKNGSKNAKPITETEECKSFFHFFSPPLFPENEDKDALEQYLMEQNYDFGSAIRDLIIPHAFSWFTGEASNTNDLFEDEDEDEDEDEEEDEEEEDEDDDEEDEDEEDDDEEEEKPKGGRKERLKCGRVPITDDEQGYPPECQQQ